MIKQIKIRPKPTIILVTKYDNDPIYYHYHLYDLSTKNKRVDIGYWKIKYKNHE